MYVPEAAPQDVRESLEVIRSQAESGSTDAQLIYGQMLLDGQILPDGQRVERDQAAALVWFERAAAGGNVPAMNMVGRCLHQGWGTPADAAMAFRWFRQAAERGLDWGMYNLANLLAYGQGTLEDKPTALTWLRKAAALDHAKSVNLLGAFHENGWVVPQSTERAAACYQRAAVLGDFRGQFNYARFLADRKRDRRNAEFWLRKVPETATPAFLAKARAHLLASHDPWVQSLAELLETV